MSEEQELRKATNDVETAIKERLLRRKMTQTELANLLGTSPQWINRAVKGQNTPKAIEIRKKIYRVLDM
ncbi:helix-turn-helix transcriptional regulator [Limosilactobacillus vaginalis]|uniref:helix-turn-helix transcriptional regulator n=1 Tax=Limosilactobacillus vaginalis TaxID=1633 RepID=UPI0022E4BAF1|nr:helix-turn-helix transcriptional regulator [Limosilactobacillus vaginalis]